jgi:hypothetical protein
MRPSHAAIAAAILAVLLLGRSAVAESGPVLSARDCPALFGNEAVRRGNRDYRHRYLHWIEQEPAGITVAHSKDDWDTPVQIRVNDVALVETAASATGRRAVLEVAPRTASIVGCAAGRYQVAMDDGISPGSRVLAVLRGLLLLDHHGRLAFMAEPGATAPRWLVAWRVRGVVRHHRSRVAPAPAPAPSSPPRRR